MAHTFSVMLSRNQSYLPINVEVAAEMPNPAIYWLRGNVLRGKYVP